MPQTYLSAQIGNNSKYIVKKGVSPNLRQRKRFKDRMLLGSGFDLDCNRLRYSYPWSDLVSCYLNPTQT